jgi:hypothetical protein
VKSNQWNYLGLFIFTFISLTHIEIGKTVRFPSIKFNKTKSPNNNFVLIENVTRRLYVGQQFVCKSSKFVLGQNNCILRVRWRGKNETNFGWWPQDARKSCNASISWTLNSCLWLLAGTQCEGKMQCNEKERKEKIYGVWKIKGGRTKFQVKQATKVNL